MTPFCVFPLLLDSQFYAIPTRFMTKVVVPQATKRHMRGASLGASNLELECSTSPETEMAIVDVKTDTDTSNRSTQRVFHTARKTKPGHSKAQPDNPRTTLDLNVLNSRCNQPTNPSLASPASCTIIVLQISNVEPRRI